MPRDYVADLRLDGKAFVVLGVGEGLGLESCRALRQAGATLACVDLDAAIAERTAAEVGGTALRADVTKRSEMEALFATVDQRFGAAFAGVVDVVGMNLGRPLPAYDEETVDRQFDLVLRHAIFAVQIAAPLLARRGGGSLTFIGSMSGIVTMPKQALYAVAKAALHHLVRTAAFEFGPTGVRVNAVAPGIVRTPRLLAKTSDEQWRSFDAAMPLGRVAVPDDIASAVLFLCSDLARYVTGNILMADGGITNTAGLPWR